MKDIKRILAVSWMTKYCKRTVHQALSLAAMYRAELTVIHVVDTLWLQRLTFPMSSLWEEERKEMEKIKEKLDKIISDEAKGSIKIKTIIKEGNPAEEIIKVIEKEKIDLVILRAHEEGRIEHFLVGGGNDTIIRKMPCSILIVKD